MNNNTTIMNESFYIPEDSLVQLTHDDSSILSGYIQRSSSENGSHSSKSLQRNSSIVSGHFHLPRSSSVQDEDVSTDISKILESSDCIMLNRESFDDSEKSSSVFPSTSFHSCSHSDDGYDSTRCLEYSATNSKVLDILTRYENEREGSQYSSSDSMESSVKNRTTSNFFQRLRQNSTTNKDSSEGNAVINTPSVYITPKNKLGKTLKTHFSNKPMEKRQSGVGKQFASLKFVTPLPNAKKRNIMKENVRKSPAIGMRVHSPRIDKSHIKPVSMLREMFMGSTKLVEERKPSQQVRSHINLTSPLTKKTASSTLRKKKTPLRPARGRMLEVPKLNIIPPTPSPRIAKMKENEFQYLEC